MPRRPKRRAYRPHGAGTLIQRADGSWQAQLPRSIDPKRAATYLPTKAEGQAWLDDRIARHRRGLGIGAGSEPLLDYVAAWFERHTWEPPTERAYRVRARHLAPIGDVRLDALRPSHVATVIAEMRKKRTRFGTLLSARYVRLVLDLLGSVLEDAVRDGVLATNPVDRVPAPALPQTETVVWSETEARRLLKSTEGTRWHAAWWIALSVGLRSGELRGLTWDDFDADTGRLRIRRSVADRGGGTGNTKGKRERWVPLSAPCVAAIERHRPAFAAGSPWMFPSPATGRPYPSNGLWNQLRRAIERAGVPVIRPHDMRHSAATFMIARGYPLPVVAEILGHRSSAFTVSRYGHVLAGQHRQVAEGMGDALSEPPAMKERRPKGSDGT